MHTVRTASAVSPHCFGRRGVAPAAEVAHDASLAGDLRLFATTFAAGFLFVSVLIF